MDRKPRFRWAGGAVSSMRAPVCRWRGASRSRLRCDGSITCFHVHTTIAFVGADGSHARRRRSSCCRYGGGRIVGVGAGSFELPEDGFFVCKEVTDKTVIVAFVHG